MKDLSYIGKQKGFIHPGLNSPGERATGGGGADFSIQHRETAVPNTGTTDTGFTSVGATSSAVVLNTSTFGANATGSSTGADDAGIGIALTNTSTITLTRESGSTASSFNTNYSILEYTGAASGANEFIVRDRRSVTLSGTTLTGSYTVSGISNLADCVPFIVGISTNGTGATHWTSLTALAYCSGTNTVNYQRGYANQSLDTDIYIVLVEFTGSNWTVLHGDSGTYSADTGTITLKDGADGTGTTTAVSSWSNSFIISQFSGESTTATNYAVADNIWTIDTNTTSTVDWAHNSDHDASTSGNRMFVHVVENSALTVTRYTSTNFTGSAPTIDITSAGLTATTDAIIIGTLNMSGTATGGHPRGRLNQKFNSTTQVGGACGTTANTTNSWKIQVIEFPT